MIDDIVSRYLPADDSFLINCGHPYRSDPDPSLTPIRISLPKPPPLHLIDGYGLEPEDQIWRRPEMPAKLVQLEKEAKRHLEINANKSDRVTGYKIIEEIWKRIENNREYYQDETEWIKKMWYYRLYGYWVFIKGKPTYIAPWHFFYLTFWKIDGSFYPQYRDKDRRELLSWHYFYNTKETFKDVDAKGAPIANNGEYEIEELLYKTFFGIAEPKGRRQGVSNKAQCCQLEVISRKRSALGVIFSMTEDSANKLFKLITIRSFRYLPFFFIPVWDGFFDQSKEIFFNRPKNIVLGNDLQSRITHAESAYGGELDGMKIDMAVYDEEGKTVAVDILKRWSTHKRASALGLNILGFSFHVSTTEDLDIDGGKYFQKLIYTSSFYVRNDITGQTPTGLATVFFPSYDGYEECVDYWGFSVIDDPTEEQRRYGYKSKHGAKKILQSERDEYLKSKDPRDKLEYRKLVVKFPFTLDECFQLTVGSASVDLEIINKRLAELRRIKESFIRGNFEWVKEKFGAVQFTPSTEGRWEVSRFPNPGERNLRVLITQYDEFNGTIKEVYRPQYPNRYTMGVDPFDFKGDKDMAIDTGGRMSDGGIAIYWERDLSIDPEDKNIYEWESCKFVAVYRNRPMSHIFEEDVIKAAIFYGAMIYPETNKPAIWKYLDVTTNFGGYLLYDWDETTKKYKTRPGCYQVEKSKQEMWEYFRNHIAFRGHKENHASLLGEIAALKSFEDLTRNDMAAASGLALLGSKSRTREALEFVDDTTNDMSWWLNL